MGLAASAQLVESNDRQFIQPNVVKKSKFLAIYYVLLTSLYYAKRTVNKNVINFGFFFHSYDMVVRMTRC